MNKQHRNRPIDTENKLIVAKGKDGKENFLKLKKMRGERENKQNKKGSLWSLSNTIACHESIEVFD